jgi:uncharacterized protein (DUF1015 family)
MPEIQPFRAFHYSDKLLKSVKSLVCPPYDVISPSGRAVLVKAHAQNFVRVELPAGDPATRYREAASVWETWRADGTMARDEAPAYYVYEATFQSQIDGRRLSRRGVFAALRLAPWGKGTYPHEKTLPTHKADRLELFKAMGVQTSSIQCLANDPTGDMDALIRRRATGKPWVRFTDEAGVTHRLWRWAPDADARRLQTLAAKAAFAIADGHHRYETSLTFSAWARKHRKSAAGASCNYVMTYFSPSGDPALEILPTHRSVPWEKRKFVNLEKWGALTPVKSLASLRDLILGKDRSRAVGVVREGRYYRYEFTKVPPALKGTPHEKLAASCLHAGPLKGLGKEDFFFTRVPEEAAAAAKKSKGWGFFLGPNTVREVLDVCLAGKVMPPKSTYFYPKIPSGLVSRALLGDL